MCTTDLIRNHLQSIDEVCITKNKFYTFADMGLIRSNRQRILRKTRILCSFKVGGIITEQPGLKFTEFDN